MAFKRRENSNLQRYLADYPMLKTLYEVKQKLIRYMLLKTMNEKRMEKTLPRFLDLLEQLHHTTPCTKMRVVYSLVDGSLPV